MTRNLYYIVFQRVKKTHPHWSNKAIGTYITYALKKKKGKQNENRNTP